VRSSFACFVLVASMELSKEAAEGLTVLGSLPDAAFKKVLSTAFQAVVRNESSQLQEEEKLMGSAEAAQVSQLEVKQSFAAVISCLLEAAKHDVSTEELAPILDENKVPDDKSKLFLSAYSQMKPEVRAVLARTSFSFPRIVGVDWRLDLFVKSDMLDQVKTPLYFLTLKTRQNDGSIKDVQFTCNLQELQDLLAKLKDSAKQVERLLAAGTSGSAAQ